MLQLRSASLGLLLGVVASLSPGCGQAPCGPTWCGGCCDSQGQCVGGEALEACGASGAACNACGAAQLCLAGACVADPSLADGGALEPTNPLSLTAQITPNPPVVGTHSMDVFIRGANGVLVPGATMTAKTWMPAMGHGSATPVVSELGGGEYQVSRVNFTMGGTWQVTLTVTAPGGLSGKQVFNYTAN